MTPQHAIKGRERVTNKRKMRTKLLLGVAAIAAGALSAVAQSNVYSLNVVGYINVPLVEGFNLVANQLDVDGTGTNNQLTNVFANNLPVGTAVYTWNGTGYNPSAIYAKNKAGTATNWTGNLSVNPGQGIWIQIPTGAGAQTVTTVGQVLQGTLNNPNVVPGFSLVSDQVPLAGGLVTNLVYHPLLGDSVYQWSGASQNYLPSAVYAKNKAGTATNWTPGEPAIAVGEAFWLSSSGTPAWSQSFQVQ